ncbi:uncharacterized protein LOC112164132 [Rosa chinensis]|nr:uncharacterized protein LOC112164132 [Rosa chinensis]
MSRKGYAGLEEELSGCMSDSELDRATMWIKARQDKNGGFKDPLVEEKAKKIAALKKKEVEGELITSGADDVLTLALGNPENTGVVRGVGGSVRKSTYFNLPKRRKQSVEQTVRLSVQKIMEQEREKILAEERAIWEERFRRLVEKLGVSALQTESPKVSTIDKQVGSGQGSCSNLQEKAVVGTEKLISATVKKSLDLEHLQEPSTEFLELKLPLQEPVKDVNPISGVKLNATAKDVKNSEVVVDLEIQKGSIQVETIEKECRLATGSIDNVVAIVTITEVNGENNSQLIHGVPLLKGNRRVSIVTSLVDEAKLPFPIKDEIVTVRDAIGTYVAWPENLIIFQCESKTAAKSKGLKKRKIAVEDDDEEEDIDTASLPPTTPASLIAVCNWAKERMRNAQTIICEFDEKIFGHPSKTFICKHDINNFVTMKEVSGSCIGIYIRYLYCVLKKTKMVDMVGFMDNTDVGAIGCGSPIERSRAIADRLKRAKRGQIILVPYNSGCHWMLTVLSPEEDIVYFMDPLKRRLCTGEWKNIVDNGIKIHNAQLKRQGRKTTTWKNCAGIPEQKSDKDCGYYVMRYMKEIVEDKSLDFFTKWERRGKATYTQEDIDVVRNEWAKFMVKTYM